MVYLYDYIPFCDFLFDEYTYVLLEDNAFFLKIVNYFDACSSEIVSYNCFDDYMVCQNNSTRVKGTQQCSSFFENKLYIYYPHAYKGITLNYAVSYVFSKPLFAFFDV